MKSDEEAMKGEVKVQEGKRKRWKVNYGKWKERERVRN